MKAANDIVDVVSGYVPVHPAGKMVKALCPFHNDSRPSLQIDRKWQNFHCWACGARGDVFDFVMKFERVDFPEALQILATRAGIQLETVDDPQAKTRARLLGVVRWAAEKYHNCLYYDPAAEQAQAYLAERKLTGPIVRQFGLGFAPIGGNWLVDLANREGVPTDALMEVGLIAARDEDRGHFDRFRDRLMFPIRDARSQTVGFGGRVLPSSPLAARGPKYYNSSETPLFSKSHLLYGLDLARQAGANAGYLAVVEGYTDVMMAHQHGVTHVVATMGTALNAAHVAQLRRYVPKVVLVFDADEGGMTGVDRALELFVSQDVELAVATLPDGLDPCDLLCQPGGVDVFRSALGNAVDAIEFKVNQLLARTMGEGGSIEATRRIIDAVLGVMALAPEIPSQAGQMKQELIVTRLAHRLGVRQETVWARFGELKHERRRREPIVAPQAGVKSAGPPPAAEKQLLQLLLAEPTLVTEAMAAIPADAITHSGLRRMLTELYAICSAGEPADLDALRVRMLDRPDLVGVAQDQQYIGRHITDRPEMLRRLVAEFARKRTAAAARVLKEQLTADVSEDEQKDLLRRLTGAT